MAWAGLCRLGGVGDDLIATTVLPGLKKKFGHVEVVTQKPAGVVFEGNPYIDRIVYKAEEDLPGSGAADWQKWFVQRAKEYDGKFYHLSHSCEFLHAQFSVSTAFHWPASARRAFYGRNYLESAHIICELPFTQIGSDFFPTEEETARAKQDKGEKLRNGHQGPVIGWVCSGTRIDKHHPRAGFAIARIINELGAKVCLFGGPGKDRIIANMIETQVRQHNGNLDGLGICISCSENEEEAKKLNAYWPLRRGLAQIQECDLVVTFDTGPYWAVMKRPMPKVLIVSHASHENIGKYAVNTTTLYANQDRVPCHPCHLLHDDPTYCTMNFEKDGPACTSDVSVEAIVRSVRMWLQDFGRAKDTISKPMTTDDILAETAIIKKPKLIKETVETQLNLLDFAAAK